MLSLIDANVLIVECLQTAEGAGLRFHKTVLGLPD
jgi:hypothetical protein